MNRTPSVTQANIARAIRAVEQTHASKVVEILPNGTIRIVPDDGRHAGTEAYALGADGFDGALDNRPTIPL